MNVPAIHRLTVSALALACPLISFATCTNPFSRCSPKFSYSVVLTRAGQTYTGSANWSDGTSIFSRVVTETNSAITRLATGRINGQPSVWVALDGRPLPLTIVSTSDLIWANQWRPTLERTPRASTERQTISKFYDLPPAAFRHFQHQS